MLSLPDLPNVADRTFKAARSITATRGQTIYLIEVDTYDYTTQTVSTLRYSTDSFNAPDAPGYYEGRVMNPPDFARFLLSPGSTSGGSSVTPGDVVLANNDRALDGMRDLGIGGRPIKILIGHKSQPYSSFIPLAAGRVEQVLFDLVVGQNSTTDTVTLRFRDRLLDFSLPLQNHRYLGNNPLPDGIEGGDDLKSKPMPLLWGKVFNVTVPCVNTVQLIFHIAENQIRSIVNIYDAGAVLTPGVPYSSLADMQANKPDPGTYRPWISSAGSYFRIGATPKGTITVDAIEGATDADLSAGQVTYRILTSKGGLTPAEIHTADLAELDALNRNSVGIYIDGESNIQVPVDTVLGSIGATGGFDRLDLFRMRRVNLPLLENVTATLRAPLGPGGGGMALGEIRLISVRFIPTNDPDRGVPTYEQTLNYRKNYTVQAGNGLAGEALDDQALVNFVNTEYRTVVRDAAWVKVGNPLAVKKSMDSLLTEPLAAGEECERQLTLYSGRRDYLELEMSLDFETIGAIDIGDIVLVALPAYGYTQGQPMLLTGMIYNTSRNILTIEAWGGRESIVIDLAETIGDESVPEDWGTVGATLAGWTGFGTVLSVGVDRAVPFDFGTLDILRQFLI